MFPSVHFEIAGTTRQSVRGTYSSGERLSMMVNKCPLGVLFEMGSGPVRIEGGLVVVLLVEEKPPGVGRRPVRQVHPAARLGDCVLGQLGEASDGFVFVARFDHEGDREADHRNLQTRFPGLTLLRF